MHTGNWLTILSQTHTLLIHVSMPHIHICKRANMLLCYVQTHTHLYKCRNIFFLFLISQGYRSVRGSYENSYEKCTPFRVDKIIILNGDNQQYIAARQEFYFKSDSFLNWDNICLILKLSNWMQVLDTNLHLPTDKQNNGPRYMFL